MASIITSTSAHFALEHHGSGSWSRLYHGDSLHGSQHQRHLQEIHSYMSHHRHHHRRSHSDQGLNHVGHDSHTHHHHHLGNSLCPWPLGQGHLHHRSHSDYLVHKHKQGSSHSGHGQDDHSCSPSVKRHTVKTFAPDCVEGHGHYHGNLKSEYRQESDLRDGYSHANGWNKKENGHFGDYQVCFN